MLRKKPACDVVSDAEDGSDGFVVPKDPVFGQSIVSAIFLGTGITSTKSKVLDGTAWPFLETQRESVFSSVRFLSSVCDKMSS